MRRASAAHRPVRVFLRGRRCTEDLAGDVTAARPEETEDDPRRGHVLEGHVVAHEQPVQMREDGAVILPDGLQEEFVPEVIDDEVAVDVAPVVQGRGVQPRT